MRNDLTDLTLVVDRSGSMERCKTDAQGGINQFIKKQKEQLGDCIFSLVQFDNIYQFVHNARPIRDVVLDYVLEPRGSTALLDAVGRAITETGSRLKATDESQRPGLVVFVIVTDGQENSSTEFTLDKIKQIIQHQQDAYKWQFIFLGANQDAFAAGGAMGIQAGGITTYGEQKTCGAYSAASGSVSRMRDAAAIGSKAVNQFTDKEREEIKP